MHVLWRGGVPPFESEPGFLTRTGGVMDLWASIIIFPEARTYFSGGKIVGMTAGD